MPPPVDRVCGVTLDSQVCLLSQTLLTTRFLASNPKSSSGGDRCGRRRLFHHGESCIWNQQLNKAAIWPRQLPGRWMWRCKLPSLPNIQPARFHSRFRRPSPSRPTACRCHGTCSFSRWLVQIVSALHLTPHSQEHPCLCGPTQAWQDASILPSTLPLHSSPLPDSCEET